MTIHHQPIGSRWRQPLLLGGNSHVISEVNKRLDFQGKFELINCLDSSQVYRNPDSSL